jgi:hypothetical protein
VLVEQPYRTSAVPELHFSGLRVNQELQRDSIAVESSTLSETTSPRLISMRTIVSLAALVIATILPVASPQSSQQQAENVWFLGTCGESSCFLDETEEVAFAEAAVRPPPRDGSVCASLGKNSSRQGYFRRRKDPFMNTIPRYVRLREVSRVVCVAALCLALALPALAQGNSPWENAVGVLQLAFTSTIARGLSLCSFLLNQSK